VVIATAVIGAAFVILLAIGAQAINYSHDIKKETEMDFLIKEEIEALRSFRDGTDWTTNGLGSAGIITGNPYYLALSGGAWSLTPDVEIIDSLTSRSIIFDKVSRDPTTKDIEATYNEFNDDPDTRKITVNVAWSGKTYQVVTYLTNWKNE